MAWNPYRACDTGIDPEETDGRLRKICVAMNSENSSQLVNKEPKKKATPGNMTCEFLISDPKTKLTVNGISCNYFSVTFPC